MESVILTLGNTAWAVLANFFWSSGPCWEGAGETHSDGQRRPAVLPQVCEHASFRHSSRN